MPVWYFLNRSRIYGYRFYGSYESLSQGGSTTRALQDLTGGIVQSFGLNNQDRYLTYQVLNSAVPRSSLLISSINLVSLRIIVYAFETDFLFAVAYLDWLQGESRRKFTRKRYTTIFFQLTDQKMRVGLCDILAIKKARWVGIRWTVPIFPTATTIPLFSGFFIQLSPNSKTGTIDSFYHY